MEYVSGFIVSFLIIGTAFSFGKTAIMRMIHPEELRIASWFLFIPVFSIVIKLALALYIRFINRMMNSAALRATFKDSLADAVVTAITFISLLTTPFTTMPLDGIARLIVALVTLWYGITSFLENLDLLLGEGADRDLTQRVIRTVLKDSVFGGVEAFALYDFGPEKQVAFLQVTLNANPHLERVQVAIKDLTASLKQEFNLEATIYWNVSHTEIEQEGEDHGSDQHHRVQSKLAENNIAH